MTITEYLLVLSPLLSLGLGTCRVNGFVYSSGPAKLPRQPKTTRQQSSISESGDFNPNFASSPRNRINQDRANANAAFRELRDEFGNSNSNNNDRETKTTDGQFEWVVGGADPFEAIDKKAAKKWIEKAFDLASELNDDFTAVSEEKDATDEMIQKSRNWIARMYYEDDETEAAEADGDSSSSHHPDPSVSSGTESEDQKSTSVPPPDKPYEVVSETPKSENRGDEEIFRVSIDLPGVDRTDVDVTVVEDGSGDFLLIRAKRDTGSDGAPVRMYSKKIAIPEKQRVDIEKLDARLKNGVLVVSAPKLKPRVSERKIAIS